MEQTHGKNDHDGAIDSPLGLAGHVTAWQYVDPLQEKRAAGWEKDHTDDVQECFHDGSCKVWVIIHFDRARAAVHGDENKITSAGNALRAEAS